MKRMLLVVAAVVGVSVVGCGGAEAEILPEDFGTSTEALCAAGTPACEDLDLTGCGRGGDRTNCCLGGNTFVCTCTYQSRVWACP